MGLRDQRQDCGVTLLRGTRNHITLMGMRNANRGESGPVPGGDEGLYIPRGVADTTRVRSPHSPLVRVTKTIAQKGLFFKDLRWPTC